VPAQKGNPPIAHDSLLPCKIKILLVDDHASVVSTLSAVLVHNGFQVVSAMNVNDALGLIGSQTFDVLLTDLHMPNAGDGLTVVSAMRNSNPNAITLILSGFPAMKEAAAAILLQADQILVKPMDVRALLQIIRTRLEHKVPPMHSMESVASILAGETQSTIDRWLARVDLEPRVISVRLDKQSRCAHLAQLFGDLVFRLRNPLPLGTRALASSAAAAHGRTRRTQGYSAAMMVEESRMLQVSIFETLQSNLHRVDFSLLLADVMAIADEVDSQLAQAMTSYASEPGAHILPAEA
jgi:DNA-binding response OmpR family regulator